MNLDPAEEALERSAEYADLGLFDEAQALVEDALTRDPGHVELLERLAYLYLAQDQSDKAMDLAHQIREVHPEMGAPYHIEVQVLQRQGRVEDALALCDEILAENPELLPFLERRATSLAYLLRHQEALDTIDQYHALSEEPDGDLLYLRIQMLTALGRQQDALTASEDLVERFPLAAAARSLHAGLLAENNRPEEATVAYKHALQLEPGHAEAKSGLLGLIAIRSPFYRFMEGFGRLMAKVGIGTGFWGWVLLSFGLRVARKSLQAAGAPTWLILLIFVPIAVLFLGSWYVPGFMLFALLLDPYGRQALTLRGKILALLMPVAIVQTLALVVTGALVPDKMWLIMAGAGLALTAVPTYYALEETGTWWRKALATVSWAGLLWFMTGKIGFPLSDTHAEGGLVLTVVSSVAFMWAQAWIQSRNAAAE